MNTCNNPFTADIDALCAEAEKMIQELRELQANQMNGGASKNHRAMIASFCLTSRVATKAAALKDKIDEVSSEMFAAEKALSKEEVAQ